MRYVRFLKTPRVVVEKGTSRKQIQCLITITSDLGDSFLPEDVQLVAEVLTLGVGHGNEDGDKSGNEHVKLWQTLQWNGGMRTLPISFPLPKSLMTAKLCVKVGTERNTEVDDYNKLKEHGNCGVVSAWSAEFDPSSSFPEAEKLVQRRLTSDDCRHPIRIWEETGESIARHLWDAGIALSCRLNNFWGDDFTSTKIRKALLHPSGKLSVGMRVLELGTGCGIVGISLAQDLWSSSRPHFVLTDLPEAQDIVERNIAAMLAIEKSAIEFRTLDWNEELPDDLGHFDVVLAADCTYNPDSSPALVNTFSRVAAKTRDVKVGVAMKTRHESEAVFFDLMTTAGFREIAKVSFQLPGDIKAGEEVVHFYVFQLAR